MSKEIASPPELEKRMWQAVFENDVEAFSALVSKDAVMVCGGLKCTGEAYASFIKDFDIARYTMSDIQIILQADDSVLLLYQIEIEVKDPASADIAGLFNVASLWNKTSEKWTLVFNMDSRAPHLFDK